MVAKSNTADVSNLGYVGRKPTAKRNSDSWFTPDIYLSSVRGVLGEITLDPFSDAQANEIVKAAESWDEDEIIILIDGKGWKENAIAWLKDAVDKRKWRPSDDNRNIYVFNLGEFIQWSQARFN